jgi:branched-chain amino acid transport system substrate-binding protein
MPGDPAIGRMHMNSKAFWAVALALCVAAGCGRSSNTVRLGVAGPITGEQAKNGQDLTEGTTLAVEEWNAKGGVLGKKIEIVVRDDEAKPKNATGVASELVDAGVAAVIGHFNSGCTLPASENYHTAGVPVITPASTNVTVTDRRYPDVFRICGRDDQQGSTAAEFVAAKLKLAKVAVLDDRTDYGMGLANMFVAGLKGRVKVQVREGFDAAEVNFRPYLTKIKDEGADLVYFGGIYSQAVPLIQQARELGINVPFMSGDGVHGYQEQFIDKLKEKAEGTFTTFPDTTAAPGYAEFSRKYTERFHAAPGPYAIYSYACANILLESIRSAGTTAGDRLAAAVHAGSFDTPVGKVAFDEKGDVKGGDYYTVWVIRGGKHVLFGSK